MARSRYRTGAGNVHGLVQEDTAWKYGTTVVHRVGCFPKLRTLNMSITSLLDGPGIHMVRSRNGNFSGFLMRR